MTEAEQKALVSYLEFITKNPEYDNRRARCMSGYESQTISEGRKEGRSMPDVGAVCLALLQHSADVEANPKAKAARPDKELLGPYKAISQDKGFKPTEANAKKLLGMYDQIAKLPNVAALTTAAKFPVGLGNGETSEFYITQGSALDTAFTKAVLDAYAGKPAPVASGKSPAQLATLTDDCFRNKNISMGQCTQIGEDQAAIYLQAKPKAAVAR